MRRLALVTASGLIGLMPLGACSLSLDGYAGPPLTTADDASDALSGEAAPDANEDAHDASTEAAAEASVPFCSTLTPAPTFCDDFERMADPQGQWDNTTASTGGMVGLAPDVGGTELLCTQPAFTSGTAGASLNKFFGQIASDVTFAFDLTVDAPPATGGFQIMSIFILIGGDAKNRATAFLTAQASGFEFAQQTFPAAVTGDYSADSIPTSVMAYGKRQRVVMHLLFNRSPPSATVTSDGVLAYDDTLFPFFNDGTTYFTAGIHYADPPAGPLTVHIDNVVVDLK